MVGVDAGADTTQMVKLGSLRNGTVTLFAVNAVGEGHPGGGPDLAITVAILRQLPNPTLGLEATRRLDVANPPPGRVPAPPRRCWRWWLSVLG